MPCPLSPRGPGLASLVLASLAVGLLRSVFRSWGAWALPRLSSPWSAVVRGYARPSAARLYLYRLRCVSSLWWLAFRTLRGRMGPACPLYILFRRAVYASTLGTYVLLVHTCFTPMQMAWAGVAGVLWCPCLGDTVFYVAARSRAVTLPSSPWCLDATGHRVRTDTW